jgi:hypothetical protein
MVEEPTEDLDVPPEAMREEEQKGSEDEGDHDDLDDHESEEEQPNAVLFTPKQLEVLLKMNRPLYPSKCCELGNVPQLLPLPLSFTWAHI